MLGSCFARPRPPLLPLIFLKTCALAAYFLLCTRWEEVDFDFIPIWLQGRQKRGLAHKVPQKWAKVRGGGAQGTGCFWLNGKSFAVVPYNPQLIHVRGRCRGTCAKGIRIPLHCCFHHCVHTTSRPHKHITDAVRKLVSDLIVGSCGMKTAR